MLPQPTERDPSTGTVICDFNSDAFAWVESSDAIGGLAACTAKADATSLGHLPSEWSPAKLWVRSAEQVRALNP
jgi:hypothetical protein